MKRLSSFLCAALLLFEILAFNTPSQAGLKAVSANIGATVASWFGYYPVVYYGAKCDGSFYAGTGTDDSVAVQAAINACNNNNVGTNTQSIGKSGCQIVFPGGVCVMHGLTFYDYQQFVGAGSDSTILMSPANSSDTMFTGFNFANWTGTTVLYGATNWGMKDFYLYGNKAHGATSQAIQVYGASYTMKNVYIESFGSASAAFYSEWAGSGACPRTGTTGNNGSNVCMEATLDNVRAGGNTGIGIEWNGPNDSRWYGVIVYSNGGSGAKFDSKGAGTQVTSGHAYSNGGWGWDAEADTLFVNTESEGNTAGQYLINASSSAITGGDLYNCSGSNDGVRIGTAATTAVRGTTITALSQGCPIEFADDSGLDNISVIDNASSGASVIGTPGNLNNSIISIIGNGTTGDINHPYVQRTDGIGRCVIIAQSGTPITNTAIGTSEVNMASIPIPAMGANDKLEIDTLWDTTGSTATNTKTIIGRFSSTVCTPGATCNFGTPFFSSALNTSSLISNRYFAAIWNANSTTAAVSLGGSPVYGVGNTSQATASISLNTGVTTYINLDSTTATSSADVIKLLAYSVQLCMISPP